MKLKKLTLGIQVEGELSMYIVIRWLIIFLRIAIWFAVGIKICSSNSSVKKTKLLNTRERKRIENDPDYGGEDCH